MDRHERLVLGTMSVLLTCGVVTHCVTAPLRTEAAQKAPSDCQAKIDELRLQLGQCQATEALRTATPTDQLADPTSPDNPEGLPIDYD